jgi:ATP-dependent helicase/DNAse subunit B
MSLTNAANAVHGLVATEELPDRQKHAIDLLLGPYRSGKTWNVIQRILEIHRLDPFAETIVVVPSQRYQTVFEQRLVEALRERAAGGASERGLVGLRIMNFYHLVQMLFRNAGKAFRIVPEQIRPSIIGRVSSALRENNELKALSEISSFIGTQQNVLGLIDEFERAALMPDEVLEQVELSAQTDSRYVELAKIYKHYWQELERLNLMDERQVAFGLRELLNAGLFMPSLQNVFIDGFDRFNKLQLQIFSELARFVNSMVISFDYAEQDGKIHPDYVWKETSYAALNAQLQGQFAVQKFEVNGSERGTSTKVSRFSVTDRFFEMEEIARRVKQSIVVDNVAPEKILVVVRSLKNYGNAIKAAFDDAGLNFFVDEAIEVVKLPVMQFLTGALKIHGNGLLRRDVINCLRSHYLSPKVGLQSWHADELDRRTMRERLVGGQAQWTELLSRQKIASEPVDVNAQSAQSDQSSQSNHLDQSAQSDQSDLQKLLLTKLSGLFDVLKPLELATASEHVKWAENLIDHIFEPLFSKHSSFKKRSTALVNGRDWFEDNKEFQKWVEQKALGEFRRALSTLLLEEAYLGPQRMSARDFVARLERLLSKANFRPVAAVKNAVTICGADLAPNRAFDDVYIAGLVEGEFPRKITSAGFVGADEIARWGSFGIDISNPRFHPGFESALFLNLAGRATREVHLSYPLHELSGEELLPSILLSYGDKEKSVEVYSIFSRASETPVSARNAIAGALSTLGTAASLSQRFTMIDQMWSGAKGGRAAQLVEQLSESIALTHGRLSPNRRSIYNGFLTDYVETGALRVPLPERWSATRLSEYGKCGFRFWVSHVLDSEPPEEPQSGLDDRLLGETYHKALELFYKRLLEHNLFVTDDPAVVDKHFDESIDEALIWLQRDSKFRPSEFWQFEQLEVRFRLKRFLRKEIQRAQKDKFQFVPKLLEASFGMDRDAETYELLTVNAGDRKIGIGGRIDRIDISAGNGSGPMVRLVDYKKGSSLITADEAYRGRNLQLALYALAVERSIMPSAHVVEGVYLSVSSGSPTGKLKFGAWEKSDEDKPKLFAQTEMYVKQFVHGIEKGNFAVEPNGLDLCKRCRHKSVCRITELDVPSSPE